MKNDRPQRQRLFCNVALIATVAFAFACKKSAEIFPGAENVRVEGSGSGGAELTADAEVEKDLPEEVGFHVGTPLAPLPPLTDAQILIYATSALSSLAGHPDADDEGDGSLHATTATSLATGSEPPSPGPGLPAIEGMTADPHDPSCLPASESHLHREDAFCSDDGDAWDPMRGPSGGKMCPSNPDYGARTLYCATSVNAGRTTAIGALAMAKGLLCALERSAGPEFVTASGTSTRTVSVTAGDECFDTHTAAKLAKRRLMSFDITVATKIFPPASEWDREIKFTGPPIKSRLGLVVLTKASGEFAAVRVGTEVSASLERRGGILRFEQLANSDGRHLRLLAAGAFDDKGRFSHVSRLEIIRSFVPPPPAAGVGLHGLIATMKGDLNRGYRLRTFSYDCPTAAEGGTCEPATFLKVGTFSELPPDCSPDGSKCASEAGFNVDYSALPFLGVARGLNATEQAALATGWNSSGPLCFNEVTTDLLPNQTCRLSASPKAGTLRSVFLTRDFGESKMQLVARKTCNSTTRAPYFARFYLDAAKINFLRGALGASGGAVLSAPVAATSGVSTWTDFYLDVTASIDDEEEARMQISTPPGHSTQSPDLALPLSSGALARLATGRRLVLDFQGWVTCGASGEESETRAGYGLIIGAPALTFAVKNDRP